MAGAKVSAWRWWRAEWNEARTPSWPPMAQPTWGVALSIPRISTAVLALHQPAAEGAPKSVVARRPRRSGATQTYDARIVVVAQLEAHLEELRGQRGDDDIAPLD